LGDRRHFLYSPIREGAITHCELVHFDDCRLNHEAGDLGQELAKVSVMGKIDYSGMRSVEIVSADGVYPPEDLLPVTWRNY
jgi:hypothetical protein